MRLKPQHWCLISLALFVAAVGTWHYGNIYSARRGAERSTAAEKTAALKAHPALTKVVATNVVAKAKTYRLSNTTQNIDQMLHNSHGLILRNALIDTAIPVGLNIPEQLRAKGAPGSYLVQSDRPLDKDFYTEISQAGGKYVSYVPNNAALVEATPEQATNIAANADIAAVLPYEPYYKLDTTLLPSAVNQQPQTNALSVTTYPGQRDAALAALTGLGATLIGEDRSPFGPTLVVNVPATSLTAVAQLPLAQEIEVYTPRRLMNDLTRVVMGESSNTLIGTPTYLGLSGSNVTVSLNDTGVDAGHPDLTNRVLGLITDLDGHGTHVAGIIAGNGTESTTVSNYVPGSVTTNGSSPHADFRGKATNATLYVQSIDLLDGTFTADADLEENASINLGPTNLISNNSWAYFIPANQEGGIYDMHAASYDAATRDAQPNVPGEQPLLFVFAAGNDGSGDDTGSAGIAGTINSPAVAKNVISVGSIDSPRFITNGVSFDLVTTNAYWFSKTDNSNLVSYFSSCGNVGLGLEGTYGRFKPDVVAPGMMIVSDRAADFEDPTNQILVTDDFFTNTVAPGETNLYPVYIPPGTSQIEIFITPNQFSPVPFPTNMYILGDPLPTTQPTNVLATDNFLVLSNFQSQNFWFFGVTPPPKTPGPVNYDIDIFLFNTNGLGDFYDVLSNLDEPLQPFYRYESGTSMSTGAVSGMLALMQEFLQGTMGITNPSPALLKAMLINGSRSLGGSYNFSVNTLGANEQGWGLPNITNCLPTSLTNGASGSNVSMFVVDQAVTNALATGQYKSYKISCADTNSTNFAVRVTLVWTDPPGNPAAGAALVNNLNLTVVDNTGNNVYIGNNFGSSGIFTEASSSTNLPPGLSDNIAQDIYVNSAGNPVFTDAGDCINNVQNVYINPLNTQISFPLTVTVSGTRVNVNAVPDQTNSIMQDYALVISSDDPKLTAPLSVTTNAISTLVPVLITIASNATPLLHQRVGANEPDLYTYPSSTNGDLSQWHFFVFTNDQFSATNQATNVAFATFLPPNIGIPRNSSADIDLYVSTNSGLTNLTPSVVQTADKSLNRGGTESITYTNSAPNEVYYIGVKSEDQQASDFGFYAVAQQTPFSDQNSDGSITANGTGMPVAIPNSLSPTPALCFAFLINPNPLGQIIRRVTVTDGIQFPTPGNLYGVIQHDGKNTVLNNFTGNEFGFTNTYDDLNEDPSSGDIPSDGPGSLTQYISGQSSGLWLLSEANDNQSLTGTVNTYNVTVDPQPLLTGFFVTLAADTWFVDFIPVPDDATNMIISAVYSSQGTNQAGSGPIGIFLTNFPSLDTSDFGTNDVVPPGGFLELGTTNQFPPTPVSPPLAGGLWYFGLLNEGTQPATLFVQVQIQENLTPNLVQTYTNNMPVPLTTDGHTQSTICINNGQQLVSMQVGVRISDTNLDDLVLHLTSPNGTSVLLFEDRGGDSATNLGLTLTNAVATNQVYTVFTEDTNLTTTPIKFAVPPFAQEVDIPEAVLWSNSWETTNVGVYTCSQTNPATVLEGWIVTNNIVLVETNVLTNVGTNLTTIATNFLQTNDEVGIVGVSTNNTNDIITNLTDTLGTNYLALTSGRILQTFGATNFPFTTNGGFAITNGQPYEVRFYARPIGITDWWPADDDTSDIIGTNDGMISTNDPSVLYDVGEVDRAFTFLDMTPGFNTNNEVDFGTNVGNFGTNDFTVDFWIKIPTNGPPPNVMGILEKRVACDLTTTNFWDVISTNGSLQFEINDTVGANDQVVTSTNLVNDGLYHHAAFVREDLTNFIYIDGIQVTNMTNASLAMVTNTNMFRAGQSVCVGTNGSIEPFVGDLDELDLFDRALSPAEIYAIYHAGSMGKYTTNSILPNFTLTIDGITTNNIILTNPAGGWQLFTNSFTANSSQVTVEFAGNAMGVLLDDIELIQLPATNYNNYYLPEEPLTPFIGENPQGCWTLDIWDTRTDSPLPDDGTLLGWTLDLTTSSTNVTLEVLSNSLSYTTNISTNSIAYFAIDVPPYVTSATNILTAASNSGPFSLFFNQYALPTGGSPGDFGLATGVTNEMSTTNILTTEGLPPALLPGQRYFLGVQNNGPTAGTFTIQVDFNISPNAIMALTNAVPYTFTNLIGGTNIGTNGVQYYSFTVPTNADMVTFQVLNITNGTTNINGGEFDLYAEDGLPLPGPDSFDFASRNVGPSDQFITVTTNSLPVGLPAITTNEVVPLPPSTWYLTVSNATASTNSSYTIIATWTVTNSISGSTNLVIIPLTNGVLYTNIAAPGFPTNILYSYTETNDATSDIQFTVTDTSGVGNLELLADLNIFPTAQDFYSGSFEPMSVQTVIVETNSTLTNLNGVWYLAVPNTDDTNLSYTIEAQDITNGPVGPQPLIARAGVSAQTGKFTVSWTATVGKTYVVQMSTNLLKWTTVTNVTAQSTTASYTDPTSVETQKARFYRLMFQTAPPAIQIHGAVSAATKQFTMTWIATAGHQYGIQIATNMTSWSTLTNVTPSTTNGSYTDPSPVTSHTARFYRLKP
jgi:subtilisin-like proprotein convertase family protein